MVHQPAFHFAGGEPGPISSAGGPTEPSDDLVERIEPLVRSSVRRNSFAEVIKNNGDELPLSRALHTGVDQLDDGIGGVFSGRSDVLLGATSTLASMLNHRAKDGD